MLDEYLNFLARMSRKLSFARTILLQFSKKKKSKEEQDPRLIAWYCVYWGMDVASRLAPCGWVDGRVAKVHLQAWNSPLGSSFA